MRLIYLMALVIAALLPAAIALGAEGPITLQLAVQPIMSEVGIPLHLHTIVENFNKEPFNGEFRTRSIAQPYERGFSFLVAFDGGKFYDILGVKDPPFEYTRLPIVSDLFRDKNAFLGPDLSRGDTVQRDDMLVFFTPGTYTIKAGLKWPDEEPYYSNTVEITIRANDPDSCISKALGEEERKELAEAIFLAYYHGAIPLLSAWEEADLLGIAERAQDDCPNSSYGAYLNYFRAMHSILHAHSSQRMEQADNDRTLQYDDAAIRFMRSHPNSWLIPDLAREVFILDFQRHR